MTNRELIQHLMAHDMDKEAIIYFESNYYEIEYIDSRKDDYGINIVQIDAGKELRR